jgi:aspartyl protease
MLKLEDREFTTGRARFFDRAPFERDREVDAKVYIRIVLENLDLPLTALLDTGAAWSVLDPETADLLGLTAAAGLSAKLSTRLGNLEGRLIRIPTTLLAERGAHLSFEATFFVPTEWPSGRIFLGYSGLLDRIRFALDPSENQFYFGPCE